MRNTDPLQKWNDPAHRDDISEPWNDPYFKDDPMAPWNDPAGKDEDLDEISMITCETCDGTGQEEWYPDYMTVQDDIGYRKCTNCNGTGMIEGTPYNDLENQDR